MVHFKLLRNKGTHILSVLSCHIYVSCCAVITELEKHFSIKDKKKGFPLNSSPPLMSLNFFLFFFYSIIQNGRWIM